MLHALGVLHEHQRPDRDQYIHVDMEAAARYDPWLPKQLKKACFLIRIPNFEIMEHRLNWFKNLK